MDVKVEARVEVESGCEGGGEVENGGEGWREWW